MTGHAHNTLPPLIGVSGRYNKMTVEAIVTQIRAAGGVPVYLGDRIYELEKEILPLDNIAPSKQQSCVSGLLRWPTKT